MALAITLAFRFCSVRRIRNAVVVATVITVFTMYIIVTRSTSWNHNKNAMIGHHDELNQAYSATRPSQTRGLPSILSKVAVVGTDISFSKLRGFKGKFNYLLIVARASYKVHSLMNTKMINTSDKQKVARLVRFLDKRRTFDGATCMGTSSGPSLHSSCYFESKNSTLLIGKANRRGSGKAGVTQCNIIEHAFVIRRKVFETLYFNPRYGEATLLDFYLRSKGKLNIAGLTDCSFSAELNRRDRGGLVSSSFFTDYIYLGAYHGVLRIVRQNEITWTKCSYHARLCPEKPLNNVNVTLSKKLFPVCCKEVLDKMLRDVVQALQSMGLDYRIEYGTLLGAVRSGTIIPWTRDIDIGLREDDYFKKNNFNRLEHLLRPKRYALPIFKGQARVIPLYPPTRSFKGSPFDPAVQKRLFSRRMMNVVKRLRNTKTRWQDLGYLDFYIAKKDHFDSHAKVKINGRSYSTFADMKQKLQDWYGAKYMKPVKQQSAPIEIDIVKRRKQREKQRRKRRKRRGKRSTRNKKNKKKVNKKKLASI